MMFIIAQRDMLSVSVYAKKHKLVKEFLNTIEITESADNFSGSSWTQSLYESVKK